MTKMLHDIWGAPTRDTADQAFDLIGKMFEAAVKCLTKDRNRLLTFFEFPTENWCHIHTMSPIEITFATIRLRHRSTKEIDSAKASVTVMFKLAQKTAKGWSKLRRHHHIPSLIRSIRFIDGVDEIHIKEEELKPSRTSTVQAEFVA